MRTKSLLLVLAVAAVSASQAQILYSTGFEAPTYTAGSGVNAIDGWANGSGGGVPNVVSTDVAASGTQSLRFAQTAATSFSSVRRALPTLGATIATPAVISVQVYVASSTGADRLSGMYFGSTATSTLGGTTAGMTLGGDGKVRMGSTWLSTYDVAFDAQAAAGTFADRWITFSMSFNGAQVTASMSGFSDNAVYSKTFTPGGALGNINLGTDYAGTTGATGTTYFDNLKVESVPEPATMTLLALGALAARRRKKA